MQSRAPSPPPESLLRRQLKARRRALSPAWIRRASQQIARRLWRLPVLARARRIGCYLSINGEVDCGPLIDSAWRRGRQVLVPVLRGRRLRFAPWRAGMATRSNRYRIPEPVAARREELAPAGLDVVLVPLLAFDGHGNRLGMGGGYYDRSFAFRLHRRRFRRPRLIGIAWQFQQVDALEARPWDVPLDGVVTESGEQLFDQSR